MTARLVRLWRGASSTFSVLSWNTLAPVYFRQAALRVGPFVQGPGRLGCRVPRIHLFYAFCTFSTSWLVSLCTTLCRRERSMLGRSRRTFPKSAQPKLLDLQFQARKNSPRWFTRDPEFGKTRSNDASRLDCAMRRRCEVPRKT